jgi:hypothetical protein
VYEQIEIYLIEENNSEMQIGLIKIHKLEPMDKLEEQMLGPIIENL